MKQVKYRLWCNNKKEWEKDAWHLTSDGIIIDTRRNIEMKKETHFLNQFTGLFDKQGVEIYEGDIVRWGLGFTGSWDNESWHRYAVAELFPSLQFRIIYYIIEKTGEKKETDNHVFEFGSFAYKETHKYLEVIGNIYENTELLESKC